MLMLAAMDIIIDRDDGQIRKDRMDAIDTALARLSTAVPELGKLADTDADKIAGRRMNRSKAGPGRKRCWKTCAPKMPT